MIFTFKRGAKREFMGIEMQIQSFNDAKIRMVWDNEKEQYFFSVVDIIQVLTDSPTPRRYWSDLKRKLQAEGSELYENIVQLKLPSSDGKKYFTDVATVEQVFRIIQSVPSKKAEPFKLWLAEVGRQRLEQLQDPELSIDQAIRDYRRLGYSETWINQRIKTIEVRKGLTDEWKRGGMSEECDYAKFGIYSLCSFRTQHAVSLHALSKESVEGQCERQNRKIHTVSGCLKCLFSSVQYA